MSIGFTLASSQNAHGTSALAYSSAWKLTGQVYVDPADIGGFDRQTLVSLHDYPNQLGFIAGGSTYGTSNPVWAIDDGSTVHGGTDITAAGWYSISIEYNGSGTLLFKVNGSTAVSLSVTITASNPPTIYFGSNDNPNDYATCEWYGVQAINGSTVVNEWTFPHGGSLTADTVGSATLTLTNTPADTADPTPASADLTGAVIAPAAVMAATMEAPAAAVVAMTAPAAVVSIEAATSTRIPIARWLTVPGVRRTSSSDTLALLVQAGCVGGISKITFSITENGGSPAGTDVTSRAIWQPDDTDLDDPIGDGFTTPGLGTASILCYGLQVAMSSLAAGPFTVTPTVHPVDGVAYTMETLTFVNDKTGDSRPSTKVIYMDPAGSDANGGTSTSDAVVSRQRAVQLATAGGSSGDCGGATILCAAGTYSLDKRAGGSNTLYCSAGYWVTFQPDYANGVGFGDVIFIGDDSSHWFSTNNATEVLRLHFREIVWHGRAVIDCYGTTAPGYWLEGCLIEPPAPWNVGGNSWITALDLSIAAIEWNHATGAEDIDCAETGTHRNQIVGYTTVRGLVRGCRWSNCSGVAIQQWRAIAAIQIHNQRQYDALGYIGPTAGGTHYSVADNGSGKMRLRSDSTPTAFYAEAADLIGGTIGIQTSGFTSGGNNGTFAVLAAGADDGSGFRYVDLDNSSFVVETGGASASVRCARTSDGAVYEGVMHSDTLFSYPDVSNAILQDIRITGTNTGRGFCCQGAQTRMLWINCGPSITGVDDFWQHTQAYDHVIVEHCDFGTFGFEANNTFNDVEVRNCLFTAMSVFSGSLAILESKTNFHHNHFVNPSHAIGTNNTTGSTLYAQANPQTASDATLNAGSGAVGSASGDLVIPAPWDTGDKGLFGGTLLGDWWPGVVGSADLTGAVTAPAAVCAIAGNITHELVSAAVAPAAVMAAAGNITHQIVAAVTARAARMVATDGSAPVATPLPPAVPIAIPWLGPLPPAAAAYAPQTGPLPPADWQPTPLGF